MRLLVWLVALLAPAVASAAAPGEGGGDVMTLVWQGVNLIILIAVVVYFARRPVLDFFRQRHDQVREDLDAAARLLSEAEARLAEWRSRAERLDAEVERIKSEAHERAARERERIVTEAQKSAERIRHDAAAAVDREVARARDALRAEAAELATELATDLLQQNVTPDDQRRLVDEFVTRVERGDGAARAER
jgi:F-type H+-transporting ATPase subunit b